MNQKGIAKSLKIILVILLVAAIILSVVVLVLIMKKYQQETIPGSSKTVLINPVKNITDAEAKQKFDESFVRYLLYSIKANELHNPPLSSETPKINIFVDELTFSAEILENSITVTKSKFPASDINIRTTKDEAIKMLRQKDYVASSFNSGASQIELIASKTKLFSKGYLQLYTDLTGDEAQVEE